MDSVSAMIRSARQAAGLTQSELARRLGTTQSSIARLERDARGSRVDSVERALAACGRRLELRAVSAGGASVDETLVAAQLRLSPGERLASFERAYAGAREVALAGRRARGELA